MKKTGKIFYLIFGLLSHFVWTAVPSAWANQIVEVSSRVNQSEVTLEQSLILTLTVRFEGEAQVGSPRLPDLPGFSVQNSWTNQSSSSRLIAGPGGMQFKTERTVEFNYNLRADKSGRQVIPPLEISVNGQSFRTDSIEVQVFADASQVPQNSSPQPTKPPSPGSLLGEEDIDALFKGLLQRPPIPNPPSPPAVKNPNELFFIHLDLDKEEVFEGEQIIANWYIYSRGNIISLDRLKFPELRGFWREILEEIPALRFVQETLNGLPYRRALLASHALFPIRPGEAKIDEYRVRATVQVPLMGGLGGFSFGQPQTFNRSSPVKIFQVKPLPTPRPQNFIGGVGQFTLRSELSLGTGEKEPNTEAVFFPARMGEPFKWILQFEGPGNAKMIELPRFDLPEGLDWVETRTESRYFKNGRSVKNFILFLMPKKTGEILVPEITFSMFNPESSQYYEVTTEPFGLRVEGVQSSFAQSRAPEVLQTGEASRLEKLPVPRPLVAGAGPWSAEILDLRFPGWLLGALFGLSGFIFSLQWLYKLLTAQKKRDPVLELQREFSKIRKLSKKSPKEAGLRAVQLTYSALGLNDNTKFSADTLALALEKLPPSLRAMTEARLKEEFQYFEKIAFSFKESSLSSHDDNPNTKERLHQLEEILVQISKRLVS
jgi:hypothetical protein